MFSLSYENHWDLQMNFSSLFSPERNSDPFICPLVQTNVAVRSLECASAVFACLPAPSGAAFFDPG